MNRIAVSLLAALSFAGVAQAQTVAITGGKLVTVSDQGIIENGTLLIVDGRIAAVGANVPVPEGAQVIDASGHWVTPGLFAASSRLGTTEGPSATGTDDSSAGGAPFSAAFDIEYGINPVGTPIAVNRIEGVTRAASLPGGSGGIFGGFGGLIHLGNGPDILFKPKAMATLSLSGGRDGSRSAKYILLFQSFAEAKGAGKDSDHDNLLNRIDKEALGDLIDGKVPVVVQADRAADIRNVLSLKKKYPKMQMILRGVAEGWMVANEIAAAKVPVIVDSMENLPGSFEALASTQENATRLARAGVTVAISSGDTANARLVTQFAGNAVAHGMSWDDAFAAITLNPARIYGVDKQLGSLASGKIADVVVWDGDPLELSSSPVKVMINGADIPLVSRQTKLRDRYMNLDDPKPLAYRR